MTAAALNLTDQARENLPTHVAIIMDGNGRWAKQRHLPRVEGHRTGAECVRTIVRACGELGIKYLTLYAFSVENWNRPEGRSRYINEVSRALSEDRDRRVEQE